MTTENPPNPHDRFAKEVLSVHANAVDFFGGILPSRIKADLDLTSLRRDPGSSTGPGLEEHFADLVFTCNSRQGTVKLSLLFEHKSSPPRFPRFQLLRYMLRLWEATDKAKQRPTVIIPIVLYHGTRRWRKEPLDRKLGAAGYSEFVPAFDYILVDLSRYSDEEIKQRLFSRAAVKIWLLVQRHIFEPAQLQQHLRDFLVLGKLYYTEEEGLRFLEAVFRYITWSTEITDTDIIKAIDPIDPTTKEVLMTGAEKMIQRGVVKGREEGYLIGSLKDKQEVLIRQLDKKFGLSAEEQAAIREVEDPAKLDRALDEILFEENKEAVLGFLA